MPFRKNVFIVGAGFSAEAGTPVVQNFFEKAMELWKDPASFLSADERPIFEQVFNYRQSLEGAESRVGIDLDNIEDLFGTVEMASQLGIGDAHTTRKNLVYVILRTLELSATKKVRGFAYTHQAGAGTDTYCRTRKFIGSTDHSGVGNQNKACRQ